MGTSPFIVMAKKKDVPVSIHDTAAYTMAKKR